MLRHTFLHIPGVGPKTEQSLWAAGLTDWASFDDGLPLKLTPAKKNRIATELHESQRQLTAMNANYFASRLPAGQHWRLFNEFRDQAAYLDIETTGLEADCTISTIAVYDGSAMTTYVNGQNLDDFADDIQRYKLLVTYNGKCFDVPVIERVLGCRLDHAHIDLRYVLAGLGFKGGLKRCETQMGLSRGDLADVDGLFAVVLWNVYLRNNDERALETLLAYNLQDVINLEMIMVSAYNLALGRSPMAGATKLPIPRIPRNPHRVDRPTVSRYQGEVTFLRSLQPKW
ncbi:ribonuclease H-like domain-containing protein [Desulfosarcina ovata]|uniref:Exonuclease n=1 Tax=Desulfosarcina ovata subsp. ovata TaxID=2752305 RepID=A0A5K8ADW5_9BACT|nr:ribonuclease H-like domain-containing protein [Desulfosarcina ovata]BBO90140.1 exonuclease [Desulfosarcina ovata subsp. ovata]